MKIGILLRCAISVFTALAVGHTLSGMFPHNPELKERFAREARSYKEQAEAIERTMA